MKGANDMTCANCNAATDNPKYCSLACQKENEWKIRRAAILESGDCRGSRRAARKIITDRQGETCAICNRSEWNGEKMPLVLDHVDGNADNWRIENLRLICPNCDAQLPTFKNRNKGNGRHWRRTRYALGLSY